MDDTKNWYESRTVIAVLVMLAATALQQFGIELGGLEEDITSLLLDAVGVLAGIVTGKHNSFSYRPFY